MQQLKKELEEMQQMARPNQRRPFSIRDAVQRPVQAANNRYAQEERRPDLKRPLREVPKFLNSNKENVHPPKHDTFNNSLCLNQSLQKGQDTRVAERKIQGAKMSADFSRILKQIDLSPVKAADNSFQLNAQPVFNSLLAPRNPLLSRPTPYQARTKIPTFSSQKEAEQGMCSIF